MDVTGVILGNYPKMQAFSEQAGEGENLGF